MTDLRDLYRQEKQSIWLDGVTRSYFLNGRLAQLTDEGVRGLTTNPTLMANAIHQDSAYDEGIATGVQRGLEPEQVYWELVNGDVIRAAALFLPLYSASGGMDGLVSVEVSPRVAYDAKATVEAAKTLRAQFDAPNVIIKIPATRDGLVAIEDTLAAGVSVNVTLIFTIPRYREVLRAYRRGIERLAAAGGDLVSVRSVASFFVSRVNTEVDGRLARLAEEDPAAKSELDALRGRAAVAQAQLAYEEFVGSDDMRAAIELGAAPQRLLWASTSAKNPDYDRLLYVSPLIGPDTINTMPESTIGDLQAAAVATRAVDADFGEAHDTVERLAAYGIDLVEVGAALEERGVAAFAKSFDDVQRELANRARELAL